MPLADAMKEATAEAHRRAESKDLQRQLVKGTLDERRLGQYLAQLQLVHAELERQLDAHDATARSIGWSDELRHSRRLRTDLESLGVDVDKVGPTAGTAELLRTIESDAADEPATLLGSLYVLEGSMNGNRFIARALGMSPMAERCAFTYFDPYGAAQPERWAAFRAKLDDRPADAERERRTVDAAERMFGAIGVISDEVMSGACGVGV
jgi:heme oxygenase